MSWAATSWAFSEAQLLRCQGESVADTAKTVSCYADIIAMRHPKRARLWWLP